MTDFEQPFREFWATTLYPRIAADYERLLKTTPTRIAEKQAEKQQKEAKKKEKKEKRQNKKKEEKQEEEEEAEKEEDADPCIKKLRSSRKKYYLAATANLQTHLPTLPLLLRALAQTPSGCVTFYLTPKKLCKWVKTQGKGVLHRACELNRLGGCNSGYHAFSKYNNAHHQQQQK